MAVAVAVAVSGGVAVSVAVPVAGLIKRFFNQKDFLINVWGYENTNTSMNEWTQQTIDQLNDQEQHWNEALAFDSICKAA